MSTTKTGYIDLQVNGYAGLDFNSELYTRDALLSLCERLRSDGVDQILATVITAPLPRMIARINRVASLIDAEPQIARVVSGIHIEGPFISPEPGYVGAHPADAVLPATLPVAEQLLKAGKGHVKLVTLAPEHDATAQVTRWLRSQNVNVAAGHSDASLDDLKRSVDAGLRLYTHLGNGCPPTLPRHDNIIQRVLSLSDHLSISFIADGHHIPRFALKNYLSLVPTERIVIVTDAISAAGLGPGRYQLGEQTVEVDEDGAAWSADRSHFAGSATTMERMVQVLRSIEVSEERICQWTQQNPERLLYC